MKITREQLKEILREELKTLNEKMIKTSSGLKVELTTKGGYELVRIYGRRGYVEVYGKQSGKFNFSFTSNGYESFLLFRDILGRKILLLEIDEITKKNNFEIDKAKKRLEQSKINLSEISMGMTNDYLDALEYESTFLRIGTGIFGKRTK